LDEYKVHENKLLFYATFALLKICIYFPVTIMDQENKWNKNLFISQNFNKIIKNYGHVWFFGSLISNFISEFQNGGRFSIIVV